MINNVYTDNRNISQKMLVYRTNTVFLMALYKVLIIIVYTHLCSLKFRLYCRNWK